MKHVFPSFPPPKDVSMQDWSQWQWQMRQSPKSLEQVKKWIHLTKNEEDYFLENQLPFSFRVTPYYLNLIQAEDDPIRKIALPQKLEYITSEGSFFDPLGERKNSPVTRIIHRYPDRVLFLITDFCSVYCRYCTRKHFTGQEQVLPNAPEYEEALNYIKTHPGITEVILSGGDPLTLSNDQLDKVLNDLRRIEHVEIIRIGTRMPVVCPMRVDLSLVNIIKKYKPVYMMTHFNHPRELTQEASLALELLVDNGIPLFNQMVLLNGVNNHVAIVQALCRRLIYLRVKPYYLFQCDPSFGTQHLQTPIHEGEEIVQELWGNLSGLAMPIFSLDIPNGGGKTTLVPQFEVSRNEKGRTYKGWDGVVCEYKNPPQFLKQKPSDWAFYQEEWNQIKKGKT